MRSALTAGLRLIRTRPLFSGAIVATLAIAIAATAAVYGILDRLLVRPLPFAQQHRIVFVSRAWPLFVGGVDGEPVAGTEAVERLAQFETGRASVGTDEVRIVRVARVTRDFFSILGVGAAAGRLPAPDTPERLNVIVVGSALAGSIAVDAESAIGRTVTVNGRPFVVGAVMPPDFAFHVRGESMDAWLPFEGDEALFLSAQEENGGAIALLHPEVSLEEAQSRMDAVFQRLSAERPELRLDTDDRIQLVQLREHWYGSLRTPLLMLLGAGGCLLLIACANTTGLLLARAAARRTETAIRAVLGASDAQLAREAVGESLVLGILATVAGVFLAHWGTQAMLALSPARIPHAGDMSTLRVTLFALAVALPAASLSGLFAARRVSRGDLSRGLGAGMRQGSFMASRTRRVLVVAQIAVTVMLLMNGGLLLRSFRALRFESTGFDARQVLTLEIAPLATRFPDAPSRLNYYRQVLEAARGVAGVQHAGMVNFLPIYSGSFIMPVAIPGMADREAPTWSYRSATPGYFESMRIPLLAGRTFQEGDGPDAPRVAIVDQSAAAAVVGTGASPASIIGRTFSLNGRDGPVTHVIVGVVGDIRQQGLGIPSYPGFYVSAYQRTPEVMNLAVRASSSPERVAEDLRLALRGMDPFLPLGALALLDARVSDTVSRRRFAVLLSGILSGAALLLSLVGLFALMSQFVAHRTHEIGVRVALGARPGHILRLVLLQGGTIAGIGVAGGLAITVATSRLVAGMLYGVGSNDPVTFTAVAALVLGVAAIACALPAGRALAANPVDALRRD